MNYKKILLLALTLLVDPGSASAQATYHVPEECGKYVSEVEKYDWDTAIALKIMFAESNCNPNAANNEDSHRLCNGSFGLMQISCDQGVIFDSAYNIKIAYEEKYRKGGWRHWSVCKNGRVNCGLRRASRSR